MRPIVVIDNYFSLYGRVGQDAESVVMAGLVPAIHALTRILKTWMPGTRFTLGPANGRTRVPGMTSQYV
jgi:hypothetical protein